MNNVLRDSALKTIETYIDKILPPTSRFSGHRTLKKQTVIEKLMKYFGKYIRVV